MPTTTTTYSFNKPVVGADEDDWGGYLNGNWDSVDDLLDGTTPVTGIDINSGTLDGVTIGGTTAGAGTFTTLTATTSITGTLATAAQPNVTSLGTLTSLTVSGDVSFGDNDKAIFGAGSDLQIYHDGSHSYISDQGTGNLRVLADNLYINNAANTQNYISGVSGGALNLFHNGSPKLATTSTGIDVTGTVTADGLTVETGVTTQATAIELNGTSFADTERLSLDFSRGGSQGVRLSLEPDEAQTNGDFVIETGSFGSTSDRLRIEANGDISFYEDTGTTPKFFWDASAESLGIGTSSPSYQLDIQSSSAAQARIQSASGSNAVFRIETAGLTDETKIYFGRSTDIDRGQIIYSHADDSMRFRTDASERMRIDSSGNVGIGTSSPSAPLHIKGGGDIMRLESTGATGNLYIDFYDTTARKGYIGYGSSSTDDLQFYQGDTANMVFYTSGAERMRIDSSGNVLVGTTDTTLYNNSDGSEGVRIAEDHVSIASNARTVFYVNRQTSDGEIINIRKDGTTVGSIGSRNGTSMTLSSSGSVNMYDTSASAGGIALSSNIVYPINNSGGTNDDLMTLGSSSVRFKDLYLSGGVYLGGTGSANKLDDYEQGTFNVELWAGGTQLALSQYGGSYVKVGNLVTINFEADCSNTNGAVGPLEVRGMPFTIADVISPTGIEANGSIAYWQGWSTAINSPTLYAEGGTTLLYVMGSTSSTVAGNTNLTAAHIGTGEFRGTITYRST